MIDPNEKHGKKYAVYESDGGNLPLTKSIQALDRFLSERANYAHIPEQCRQSPECWARELAKANFSTDANFEQKILAAIDAFNLKELDKKPQEKYQQRRFEVMPRLWVFDIGHGSNTAYADENGQMRGAKFYTFNPPLSNGQSVVEEYSVNYKLTSEIIARCKAFGVQTYIINPENYDVSLGERVRRANALESKNKGKTALISIHTNAAGADNEFAASHYDNYSKEVATGAEVFTYPNSNMQDFAEVLIERINARLPNWGSRGTKEANFFMLRKTSAPSVLGEFLFFDNRGDMELFLNDELRGQLVEAVAETIAFFDGKRELPENKPSAKEGRTVFQM